MAAKIKACAAESGRHTWKHLGNKTAKRETLNSVEFSKKGVYRCATCGVKKLGAYRPEPYNPDADPASGKPWPIGLDAGRMGTR